MLRLFVAIEVPPGHKDAIAGVVEAIRPLAPTARWTSRESWHVTLKFLGATAEDSLDEVSEVVAAATAGAASPATAALGGLGAFPSFRRARVLWVGLDEPAGVLAGLAGALEKALSPLGFPEEGRPWSPHLTVARLKVPAPVPVEPGAVAIDARPFEVADAVLFRSHLGRAGAVYEALARFRLGG